MVEILMSRSLAKTLFWLCLFLSFVQPVEAKVRHHKWEVKYEYKSPDCYKKPVITINGRSAGPTINAQQGDTVIVELKNSSSTENVAIHWHGIRQHGAPWSDGTEGATQCPIVPGDTFVYKFVLDRQGDTVIVELKNSSLTENVAIHWHGIRQHVTSWSDGTEGVRQCPIVPGDTFMYKFVLDRPGIYLYHAHYGMQIEAGLYGLIRVSLPDGESEPFYYDHDRSIILTDWYHRSTYEQATGLASIPFVWVGEPQSILIQGRGKSNSNCSTCRIEAGLCNATNPECSPFSLTLVPGKTYRLRIGSLTALSALTFEIEGHNITVVEADGHNVEPFVVQNLFIYSGETYSVLIKADQDPSRNYWASAHIASRNSNTSNGLGIINYYPNHRLRSPPTIPPVGPQWNDTAPRIAQYQAIKALKGYISTPPEKPDRVIVLLNTQNKIDGHVRWSVNNVSFGLLSTPYLVALKQKQTPPPEVYDAANYDIFTVQKNVNATTSNYIYRLKFNPTVDLILQNANTMTVNNNAHPWHLHGHDFWVLGYGKGKFNISTDPQKYNLVNPIMKNSVPVLPYGWTALRLRANNPGVWLYHWHIESHFFMGMGVVFEEGIEKVGRLPTSIMECGESK